MKYQLNPLMEVHQGRAILAAAAAIPTVAGAGIGALTGLKKDQNGERHVLRNAAIGGGIGLGATGASLALSKGDRNLVKAMWNKNSANFLKNVSTKKGKISNRFLDKAMKHMKQTGTAFQR